MIGRDVAGKSFAVLDVRCQRRHSRPCPGGQSCAITVTVGSTFLGCDHGSGCLLVNPVAWLCCSFPVQGSPAPHSAAYVHTQTGAAPAMSKPTHLFQMT